VDFLRLLEGLRTPVLNVFFQGLTELGGEAAFLVAALAVFWCVDKRRGYYLMFVGLFGTILSQSLKLVFRVPRPWVLDPKFTIVESARAGASGYSFPSGHTQTAVGIYGGIGVSSQKKWVRIVCLALVILVPFSRMYLGVHTPLDVGAAFVTAALLVLILWPLLRRSGEDRHIMPLMLLAVLLCSAAYLVFVTVYPFPKDTDAANLAAGVKNAYSLAGAALALIAVYALDEKKIHFKTQAPWYGQLLKLALGLALLLAIKSGLKAPLNSLLNGSQAANFIRYFLVVLTAGCVWPLTFPFFARLGRGKD
jgi:membrane-associated phospholipid phosphatase